MRQTARPISDEPSTSIPALLIGAWVALALSLFALLLCFSTLQWN